MSERIDDILSVIDAGLQSSGEHGYQEPTGSADPAGCVRDNCRRPVDDGSDFCGPCRAFMLGDTDQDPVAAGLSVGVANRIVSDSLMQRLLDELPNEPAPRGGFHYVDFGDDIRCGSCDAPVSVGCAPSCSRFGNRVATRQPLAMSVLVPLPWPAADKPRIRVALGGWRFRSRRFNGEILYHDEWSPTICIRREPPVARGAQVSVDGLTVELDTDYRIEWRDITLPSGEYQLYRITGTVVE